MTVLLDSNVLVALLVQGHVHHDPAEEWLVGISDTYATCPITEGALVRHLVRAGESIRTVAAVLDEIAADSRHEFWADDLPYREVRLDAVLGHRQVTDAYLVGLAREQGARLATFDRGLAALYPEAVELIPAI